ncbi:hypothetical protein [Pragia fontium]|uniref:Uncharacterized protein n=1 Tax=Pragia fontium DSM 5563 = ATCC 49100 TaxID=1122977 RepID=A0AAJ4WBN3_9GAMM|nr:hypothetical protein [Pragia fontium]AKJ42905.1 hypothetical protein QQ39_13205 [Pragia fontium]SFD05159.1 hypothetical protein SAMN02745723_10784 [Pragia fontium DSM 5563 = ATCC 49100]VEJ56205.1 Uncharacterised protein [Pragia fontium]
MFFKIISCHLSVRYIQTLERNNKILKTGCNRYLCGLMLFVLSCYGQATQLGEYFDSLPAFDKVYLLCETKNNKYVALYGNVDKESKPISLFYVYGGKNNPELIYPSLDYQDKKIPFEHRYYTRPFTSYLFILFRNQSFLYTLGYEWEKGKESLYLNVISSDSGKEYYFPCKKVKVNELSQIAKYLSCNRTKDEAMGCLSSKESLGL